MGPTLTDEQKLAERKDAGARGELWQVTAYYEFDKEKRVLYQDNLYTREMKNFRENVYSIGLLVPDTPNRWRVVPPRCVGDIFITKQSKFFEP